MHRGFCHWFLEQLAMYAAYHRDRRNRLTHHIGVPLIVFSLLLALSQVPVVRIAEFSLTGAAVVLGLLLLGYIAAVPLIGVLTAIFYAAVYGLVVKIAADAPQAVWTVAGAGFVVGWIFQFVGHAFEGRRPALTVNALQAFMAPPFLIAEMLFALGFERDLEGTLQERAVKYLPKLSSA
ncbi:MAG: DUF962 domain-containing protein [Rhodospirillaceae bacterium]|nr:DUF962 domain-containing protein [Rhodospirillaceae bacterium]